MEQSEEHTEDLTARARVARPSQPAGQQFEEVDHFEPSGGVLAQEADAGRVLGDQPGRARGYRILDARFGKPGSERGLGQIEAPGGAARVGPLVPAQGAALVSGAERGGQELAGPRPIADPDGVVGFLIGPGHAVRRRLELERAAGVRLGQRGRRFADADALPQVTPSRDA